MTRLLVLAIGVAVSLSAQAAPVPDSLYRLYATREFDRAGALLDELVPAATRPADRFAVMIEKADYLLDKRHDYAAAEAIYRALVEEFPKERLYPEVRYRLALTQELREKYLEAAQNYEIVATRHMKSRFGEDALDAIERCFRKNYQDRVAYVDGHPITRIELDDRISRHPAGYEHFERKEFLLDTMIDNRLLHRAALDAGLLTDPDFARAYRDMRDRYVFEAWQSRNVTAHAEPTERELRATYNRERESRFTTPEKVRAAQLVVPSRELADSLRRVLLGADAAPWESLTARFSTAPDKDRGGDLGLFSRGMRDKAIENEAFKLRPGQVSRPVSLDTAWALVRVTERTPRTVKPFDEARNQLATQVRQEKTEQLYEAKTEALANAVTIVIDTAALDAGDSLIGTVDGVTITRESIERRIEQIPVFFRSQFQSPEGVRRILEQVVLEQLIITDAEASHDWLANSAVSRILDRRARMLVDHYTGRNTTDKIVVEPTEIEAEYRSGLDEYRVPARVHAREVVAPTRTRANQLRRWAQDGKLPALISGRALLVTDPALQELAAGFVPAEETDSLAEALGFTTAPRAVVPGTPTLRVGNRLIPDMGHRCELAGPYPGDGAYSMGFADRSAEDTLFLPELREARDAAALAVLFDTEPLVDEDGVALVDENRLGTYVRFARPLPAAEYRRLHAGSDDGPAPVQAPDGRLFFNVTRHDAAPAGFEEIARRFSTSASRHSGGDLYWFDRDDPAKDKQVIDAAFRLNKGALSPVVKVNDSTWTFIKVEDKQAAYVRPLEEVSPKIEAGIRSRKAEEMRAQLLGDLRAAAEIEVKMTPEDFVFEVFEDDPPAPTDEPAGAVDEN